MSVLLSTIVRPQLGPSGCARLPKSASFAGSLGRTRLVLPEGRGGGQWPNPHRRRRTEKQAYPRRKLAAPSGRRLVFSFAIAAATLLESLTAARSGKRLRSCPA